MSCSPALSNCRWHMRGGMRVPYNARTPQQREQQSRFGHWPSFRAVLLSFRAVLLSQLPSSVPAVLLSFCAVLLSFRAVLLISFREVLLSFRAVPLLGNPRVVAGEPARSCANFRRFSQCEKRKFAEEIRKFERKKTGARICARHVRWGSCQLAAQPRVGRSVGREDRPPQWGVVHEHTPVSIPVFMNTKIANSNFH